MTSSRIPVRLGFFIMLLIIFASPPLFASNALVHNNEIIVKMKPGKTVSALQAKVGREVARVYTLALSYATYEVLKVPEGVDPYEYAEKLSSSGLVEVAYPNVRKQVSGLEDLLNNSPFIPNDPYFLGYGVSRLEDAFDSLYKNQWGLLYTNAPLAWKFTTGSPNVVVAIIDTGIKFLHPELDGRLWVNPGEVPGNSIDDDGNGFVDDVNGYDFASWDPERGNFGDPDPSDPQPASESHGTFIAGILGARINNGNGIAGIAGGRTSAEGIRLMILRVGTNTDISVSAEVAALDYAVTEGAKIINMSFGGRSGGPIEEEAVRQAYQRGAILFAAGGNIGYGNPSGLDYPAAFDEVICVGATDIFDSRPVTALTGVVRERVADYSKTGPEMDIVAPGTNIVTIFGTNSYTTEEPPREQFTGTSAATPLVSGFAALILSYNSGLTNNALWEAIKQSSQDLGEPGWDQSYGWGRIDMWKYFSQFEPPAEIEGDANRDGVVDEKDVEEVVNRYGARRGDPNYKDSADTNNDGVIDELDIFAIGRNFGKRS